ncbi:hypothetical protein ACFCW7_10910 [Paenibacillus glucanolyticus]|uniref:hypothetical protein n=1 Tax=Paenibacillus glucanolyticus TaxID=59843 RepID=UPI0035DEADD5
MISLGLYRKKPVVVEAVKFNTIDDIFDFVGLDNMTAPVKDKVGILTLEGVMWAKSGDYIIKGVNGEFYPCKSDIFNKTYEEVAE